MDKTGSSAEVRVGQLATSPSTEHGSGYRWLIGLWAVVAIFAAITLARSLHLDIPLRDPGGRMFSGRLRTALGMLVVFALVDAVVRTKLAGRWSLRMTAMTLRLRWPRERIALAVSGLLAYHLVYVSYRNLKSWDSFNAPRDEELLRFDEWFFLGNSPAELLHDLLGHDVAAHVLAFVYRSFTYLVPLSVVGALVFLDRIRDGYMMLTAAIWVWILGVGAYYLIPSLGPFASAPEDFVHLAPTAITRTQVKYLEERAHLLANPEAGDAFASISAFASLHVGFTCMVMFMLFYFGFRRAAYAMAMYLGGTIVATIYFGWHFVSDDVAGIVLAALAVLFAHLMVYPRGRPPGPAVSTSSTAPTPSRQPADD